MKTSKYLKNWSKLVVVLFIAEGCHETNTASASNTDETVRSTAVAYFETFSERSDWKKLCSFYREDVQFSDVTLQLNLDSLWQFKRFYNWDGEADNFKKLSPDQEHLTIESLVVDDRIAVARGRVNPFYYYGELIDVEWGMEFTIWLYFDEELKIKKQVDWMEYDPLALESTIKRCRENGFEVVPEWLDLTK